MNEAFVIDEKTKTRLIAEDPKSEEIIKPWLRGRDIKKWLPQWASLHAFYIPWRFDISRYPSIENHLQQFREQLESRNASERGRYEWYALQRYASDYVDEFSKPKILWPGITSEIVFSLDEHGYFGNDNIQLVISGERFLLAILNSKLIRYVLQQAADKVRGGFYRLKIIYIEQLPIPPATVAQQAPIIALVEQILAAPDSPAVPQLEAEIDRLVYALYNLTEEEIALVEGKK